MPTGIIDCMGLDFTLKWAPAVCFLLLIVYVGFKEYTSSIGFHQARHFAAAIAVVTFVLVFYLFFGLLWLVRQVAPIEYWVAIGIPYLASAATALLTLVLPTGSVFNPKPGDLLRLPAMAVLVIPSRVVSSPGERGYRARRLERQRIAETLKSEINGETNDVLIKELKEKPMVLVDMVPSTDEVSLVAVAIKYGKLDIAKHWIDRGANLNESSRVLASAAATGNLELVKYLMARKAEPIAGRPFNFRTLPVWQAFKAGKSEMLNFLIETAKAQDPNYPDYVFQISIKACESELANEALRHGANHKSVNEFGPHFLFSVARSCHSVESAKQFEDFFRLAQKLEVDFKAPDQYGKTIAQYLDSSDSWKLDIIRKIGVTK
jgi:hypothetical protein